MLFYVTLFFFFILFPSNFTVKLILKNLKFKKPQVFQFISHEGYVITKFDIIVAESKNIVITI